MKYDNGAYVDFSPEEQAELEKQRGLKSAEEARRRLSLPEIADILIRENVQTITADDQTALRMAVYYPKWVDLVGKSVERKDGEAFRFTHKGKLFKLIPLTHTFQAHWEPGVGTESLYVRIDVEHTGERFDPIPYEGNMALVAGLYYAQDCVVYLCTRDTGSPVYHALRDLVEMYVEKG